MKPDFFITKGSLVRCGKEDLVTEKGIFIEDKAFFIKDWLSQEFKGIYKISNVNSIADYKYKSATIKYVLQEIDYLIKKNLIFKLSDNHLNTYYSFNLILKTAFEMDLFYGSTNHLVYNTIYYNLYNNGTVSGPYQITLNDSPEIIRRRMEKREILVPSKKQLFEPYIKQKSA